MRRGCGSGPAAPLPRALVLIAAACLGCGCSGLQVGVHREGVVVEAEAISAPGETPAQASAVSAAEGKVLAGLLDLFVSSQARASSGEDVQEKILSQPRAYLRKIQVVEAAREPGATRVRIRAMVVLRKLMKDLDDMGLVRPEGVYGTPRILIAMEEAGPGAGRDVGAASHALRRQLAARGYQVFDQSDRLDPKFAKTGSRKDAQSAARAAAAHVVFSGSAKAQPVQDLRISGYHWYRGFVSGTASLFPSGTSLAAVSAEATAMDLAPESAAAKALHNAGDLAAEKLTGELSSRFRERSELFVTVLGMADLDAVRRLVSDVRAIGGVVGAVVAGLGPREVRLRVFAEKISPDDLAVLLVRLPGYRFVVRAVEPDYNYVEIGTGGEG